MTHKQAAEAAVEQIEAGLAQLTALMSDPASLDFDAVAGSLEKFEEVMAAKGLIDAAFAWLADRTDAGRLVGSVRTLEYLVKRLGISRKEALQRLKTGASLFSPPPPPPPPPPPEPEETPEERAAREERERRAREKAREKEAERRRAQEEARAQAAARSAEILRIIEAELAHLNEGTDLSREELYQLAVAEAEHRTPEDLRDWLRHRVARANRAGQPDLTAAFRKRFLHIGEPDADGGRRISGYLAGAEAAMLVAALAPGERAGSNQDPGTPETRTRGQRRADQLSALLKNHLAVQQSATRYGVGSILMSITAEDIEDLGPASTFTTNTGDTLNPFDLLRLGAAQYDVMVLHDTEGRPLTLGRGQRLASFWQRLALLAAQGVCGCSDCTTAGVHLEAHHLIPWDEGGPTDVDNLWLLCTLHHADNDDTRTGAGGKGWFVRCPTTGRVGKRAGPGAPIDFNDTQAQQQSNGARIRARQKTTGPVGG